MKLHKTCRRWITSLLVAVFVGLQLAAAAYACAAGSGRTSPDEAALAMAAMPDCAEMAQALDDAQPQLCKAHCDQNKQSVNTSPTVEPGPAQTIDWLFSRMVLQLPPRNAVLPPEAAAASAGPPQGAPPVYIAFLVLRD